jgi:ribosomal peptide maturation radical SAM protein 1
MLGDMDVPALPPGDVCLVVPPLGHVTWPALGVHVLQAVAAERSVDVRLAYLNVLFARRVGLLEYAALANAADSWLLGERLLGWRAWDGMDPERAFDDLELERTDQRSAGGGASQYLDHLSDGTGQAPRGWGHAYDRDALIRAAYAAGEAVDALADAIVAAGYPIVGATTSYDQTGPAIALLRAVKERAPHVRTVLGGANCEGGMGDALAALSPHVDHVFSGESEATFLAFLDDVRAGRTPAPVLRGTPCEALDALPAPRFDDYLDQLRSWLPEVLEQGQVWLTYETSRGCWWGEKQHCTFCGLNGMGMAYRAKSPEVVLRDLAALSANGATPYVAMADNILPHSFHKTVVPHLAEAAPGMHLFYEVKANLTLDQVGGLADAGIKVIQPGIESLSTPVLRRMRKGVLARQNLALLRYSEACGVMVKWNLLYAFPGDEAADYTALLDMMPRLHHLVPPNGAVHLSIDRFSPYFDHPDQHGITELRPLATYARVFPAHADIEGLAYHFEGTWSSASKDDRAIRNALWDGAEAWHREWLDDPPVCQLTPQAPGTWLLHDTRGGGSRTRLLTDAQAQAALVGGPWDRIPAAAWAVREGLALALDGWCVPLALAQRGVLEQAEARWARPAAEPEHALTALRPVRF